MFTKKQSERILAISLFVAAFSMLTVFVTVCIRRKSLAKALLAVAAMEGAVGTFILWRQRRFYSAKQNNAHLIMNALRDKITVL